MPDYQELLQRYDRPGPRYTSYPTAPAWNQDFGPEDYADRLRAAGKKTDHPLSLYVHIPYCQQMCWFCGCTTIISQNHDKEYPYVEAVLREARMVRETMGNSRAVVQHHWGGGTPTFLSPENIEKLFLGICEFFPLDDDAEVSIEVDPRVTTDAHLETLAKIGFNRISMGVQDFDPKVQETVNRIQSFEKTRHIVQTSRDLGFVSANLDLIYGLPYQTPESYQRTLDLVQELAPDRIACYSYAYVPWLKKHQKVIPEDALPKGHEKLQLYLTALESFSANHYVAIGMDHFARNEDELSIAARNGTLHRNFMGYSTHPAEDMVSFGTSSISEMDGAFAHNYKTIPEWREAVDAGRLPIDRGHVRSQEDERRRRLILSLMCRFRADFEEHGGKSTFPETYRRELSELAPMVGDGLITISSDSIQVTETGRLFIRNICMVFDAYLDHDGKNKGPMYSRTV